MSTQLAELQRQFMGTLLGEDTHFSDQVIDQGALSRDQRVSIYTNAYRARLTETIETDHEILGYYLGDDLFAQMATEYITQYPSHYRSLRHFSESLPRFLKENEPFSNHPVLSELARFERHLLYAFDAAEAHRATLEELQALPHAQWPGMTLRFHPSVQLFETRWNCVESWQALKQEQAPPPAESFETRYWLLWRNHEQLTEFKSLADAELTLFHSALNGQDFATICETLAEFIPAEEVGQVTVQILMTWLQLGIISQLITEEQ